jgi:hypothetical protein
VRRFRSFGFGALFLRDRDRSRPFCAVKPGAGSDRNEPNDRNDEKRKEAFQYDFDRGKAEKFSESAESSRRIRTYGRIPGVVPVPRNFIGSMQRSLSEHLSVDAPFLTSHRVATMSRLSAAAKMQRLPTFKRNYGRAVPDFDFTSETSELLSVPSAVTSLRKLVKPTVWPERDLV